MADVIRSAPETQILEPAYIRDAFGRYRSSPALSVFQSVFDYDKQPRLWDEQSVGGSSTATYLANSRSVLLSIGTASGDRMTRQQHAYNRYQAGKGQLTAQAFLFGTGVANVARRAGYFDASNGVFFQQVESTLSINTRTDASGSVVTTTIDQSSWNADRLDGSGGSANPSGKTLDVTKLIGFGCDFVASSIFRLYFVIDGLPILAHQIPITNALTGGIVATPSLPLRYEIENLAGTAGASTMVQAGSVVFNEGPQSFLDSEGYSFGRSASLISLSTTEIALLALRVRPTFAATGRIVRGVILPYYYSLMNDTNRNIIVRFRLNPTSIAGGSWVDRDTNTSIAQTNIAMTSFSGGLVVFADTLIGNTRASLPNNFLSQLLMTNNIDGSVQDTILITGQSDFGSTNVSLSLNWKEFF